MNYELRLDYDPAEVVSPAVTLLNGTYQPPSR